MYKKKRKRKERKKNRKSLAAKAVYKIKRKNSNDMKKMK